MCDGGVGDGRTLVQIGGIGQTYTVSPTFVLDGTFGWTRFGQARPPDLGTNFGLDVLGIRCTGPDPREAGCHPMFISAIPIGQSRKLESPARNDQSFTFNTNASWTRVSTTSGLASTTSTTR